MLQLCLHAYIYIYIRGGTVNVFVPNATILSVRCMKPYDEYRIQKGALAVMQRCLITASRRTENPVACLNTKSTRQWPCADYECVSHMDRQELCARVSYLSHSAQIQIFPNISMLADVTYLNCKLLFNM